jgi:anti-sigma factor RsiW
MNHNHLTSEQIAALLSDPESRDRSQHLSGCTECSAELESLQEVMDDLRLAAIASAAEHRRVAVLPVVSHRTPWAMWGLLATAALICIAGPLAVRTRPAHVTAIDVPQQQMQGAVSDEQLMSNIQDDLSSSVPEPMMPLTASVMSSDQASATSRAKEN